MRFWFLISSFHFGWWNISCLIYSLGTLRGWCSDFFLPALNALHECRRWRGEKRESRWQLVCSDNWIIGALFLLYAQIWIVNVLHCEYSCLFFNTIIRDYCRSIFFFLLSLALFVAVFFFSPRFQNASLECALRVSTIEIITLFVLRGRGCIRNFRYSALSYLCVRWRVHFHSLYANSLLAAVPVCENRELTKKKMEN